MGDFLDRIGDWFQENILEREDWSAQDLSERVGRIVLLTEALIEKESIPNPAQDPGLSQERLKPPGWSGGIPSSRWYALFGEFASEELVAIEDLLHLYGKARLYLGENSGDSYSLVEEIPRKLEMWSGDARDSFDQVIADMKSALENQRDFDSILIEIVQAHRRVVEAALKGAKEIADETIAALEARLQEIEQAEREAWFKAAGIIGAAGVGAFAGGVIAGDLIGELATKVREALENTVGMQIESMGRIDGPTANQITDSMEHALAQLQGAVRSEEEKICRAIERAMDYVSGEQRALLLPKRVDYGRADSPTWGPEDFEFKGTY